MCSCHGPCLHVLPRSALLGAQQRASRVRGPISLLRVKIHRERSTERAQGQHGISEVSRTGAFPSTGPGGCLCWGGGTMVHLAPQNNESFLSSQPTFGPSHGFSVMVDSEIQEASFPVSCPSSSRANNQPRPVPSLLVKLFSIWPYPTEPLLSLRGH